MKRALTVGMSLAALCAAGLPAQAGMADPFAATLKPYETPLGSAPVDRDFVEALGRRYGESLLGSEGAHRVEHSIEFQMVMLRWALGERRPFTVVPILASFLHEAVWTGGAPEADPRVPRLAYSRTSMRSLAMVPMGTPEPVAALGAYWCAFIEPDDSTIRRLEILAQVATIAFERLSQDA